MGSRRRHSELPLFNSTTANINIIGQTRTVKFIVHEPLQVFRIAYVPRNDTSAPMSLHATLNKRLRSLEKKEYLGKAGKKWCLKFKGIIAAVLIQKTPRPLSEKWTELVDFFAKYFEEHFSSLSNVTIQVNGVTSHPLEATKKTGQMLRTFDDWIALSNYVKGLIQTGVINFDVISNETLFTVILSEASQEQVEALMKDWNLKVPTSTSNERAL